MTMGHGDARIRKATTCDWPNIEALLRACGLPLDGAQAHVGSFVVAVIDDDAVACAGIENYGGAALLRSVAVRSDAQSRGIGKAMLKALTVEAREAGIRTLYLLTTDAAGYFTRIGFLPGQRQQVPAALEASAEFQGACPATAMLMVLQLNSD